MGPSPPPLPPPHAFSFFLFAEADVPIWLIIQVADVKKNIESVQGQDVYPAAQQMLIHQGKVLKDTTTLEENKVAENSFVVIMLSKVVTVLACVEQ